MNRKHVALAVMLFAGVVTSVGAQNSAPEIQKAAEEKAVNLCSTCHGPRGISTSAEFPILAAQRKGYLEAQIDAFRKKTRAEKDAHDFMWGIAGITNDDNFVSDELLFGDLTLWGIFYLVLGALQLAAAWLIAQSRRSGQVLGIVLAVLSAVNAMFTFAAYPLWSATILIVDLLLIYGLSVHGDDYA